MGAKTPRGSGQNPAQDQVEAPVALPHVVVTVTTAGELDVTVDGTPFSPTDEDGVAWTRGSFGELMDAITADRTIAVRIEVRETDGSVFTDIIHARRPTRPDPTQHQYLDGTEAGSPGLEDRPHGRGLAEVTGDGFVPGEDVAVAVIVTQTDATGTGEVRALIDTHAVGSVLRGGSGEVVLLGRVSGTLHMRRLP